MGASFTLARAPARDATDRRSISLELSLASFFPSHPGALRGGSAAIFARFAKARVVGSGFKIRSPGKQSWCACIRFSRIDCGHDVDPTCWGLLRFSGALDLSLFDRGLGFDWF